jgi:hypothetical protein
MVALAAPMAVVEQGTTEVVALELFASYGLDKLVHSHQHAQHRHKELKNEFIYSN